MDIRHDCSTVKLACHMLAFIVSIAIWWIFPSTIYVEAIYMVGISLYVILANLARREILPAMGIILIAYAVRGPVGYLLYGTTINQQISYFAFCFFFNLALSWCLFKFHCSQFLQSLLNVQFCRQWIPQVVAICIILSFSSISILCIVAELVAYKIEPDWFSQTKPPFFYGMYQYTSTIFSCLMLLGVWSMMLDAHYLKARLEHKKNSLHF